MKNKSNFAVIIILRILLVISVIFFVIINIVGAAFGIINSAGKGENWPLYFQNYGYMLILAAVILTAGAVLCLLKFSRISSVLAVSGTVVVLFIMEKISAYADEAGFYSALRDMPASSVYRQAFMPVIAVCILILALSLIQYFLFSAKDRGGKKSD
ncbi:MAG: hypothetical protein PUA84_09780 [Oscillospiraceae bacterium]|nr:hypothetical protein [Oscillospiraceae bacterium]